MADVVPGEVPPYSPTSPAGSPGVVDGVDGVEPSLSDSGVSHDPDGLDHGDPTLHTSQSRPSQGRRRPSRLSSEQRQAIRMQKKRNSEMTQAQLAMWAFHEFGLTHIPSQGMVSVILSKVNYTTRSKQRDAEAALNKFETKMVKWLRRRKRGISVRGTQRKAKTYARRYLVEVLRPSQISREWTIAYLVSHNALSKKQLIQQIS